MDVSLFGSPECSKLKVVNNGFPQWYIHIYIYMLPQKLSKIAFNNNVKAAVLSVLEAPQALPWLT